MKTVKFTIPQPLQDEHGALHERLRQVTQAGGGVGEAAKALEEEVMYPAAVLVGRVVRQRLRRGAPAVV